MAVQQQSARAARGRHGAHLRMSLRLQAQLLYGGGRRVQDRVHVVVRGRLDSDEFDEGLSNVLGEVHTFLRSSSLFTSSIAWSVWSGIGPSPMGTAPLSSTDRSS